MKIGTSLGKCVKSLLEGEVTFDEVLYVVSNTRGPDEAALREIMSDYYHNYYSGRSSAYDLSAYTELEAQDIAARLFNEGKLFQPRIHIKDGWGNAHSLQDTWYDILPSQSSSAAAKEAWDHYVFLSKMTS